MSFLNFFYAIPDFVGNNYARIPKPIRFMLHPFWMIIFMICCILLSPIGVLYELWLDLTRKYKTFDDDRG